MTLEEAIGTARSQSVAALQAKHAFVSTYWAYRSYQASRLPSLNLYGNLMNFDRSLTLLQSYEDGTFRYANSYNLQNSLGLSVAQNVTFTGGRLSVYSDLRRIDQYGAFKNLTWYSQPITVSYNQPLFAYNQFKWDKLIEPKEYERGRRQYIESMEDVTIAAAKSETYYCDYIKITGVKIKNEENTSNIYAYIGEDEIMLYDKCKVGMGNCVETGTYDVEGILVPFKDTYEIYITKPVSDDTSLKTCNNIAEFKALNSGTEAILKLNNVL